MQIPGSICSIIKNCYENQKLGIMYIYNMKVEDQELKVILLYSKLEVILGSGKPCPQKTNRKSKQYTTEIHHEHFCLFPSLLLRLLLLFLCTQPLGSTVDTTRLHSRAVGRQCSGLTEPASGTLHNTPPSPTTS